MFIELFVVHLPFAECSEGFQGWHSLDHRSMVPRKFKCHMLVMLKHLKPDAGANFQPVSERICF